MSNPSDEELIEIYQRVRTIAVVGASADPDKPSHKIPAYLQSVGYRIIPVNPSADELFGEPVHRTLADIDEPVDVVDVFRPPAETPAIARQAAEMGASVLWLQVGISSSEAERIATEAGMTAIMDLCMGATHKRLVDQL